MKQLWILLVCSVFLNAEQALFIDLTGEWRQSADDNPAYALPDFDDRSWSTVTLPWQQEPKAGVFWLRRSVDLPGWADKTQLALTLGPVRPIYEVYINGALVGQTSPFNDDHSVHPARSRIHLIPAEAVGSSSRLTISIRTRDFKFGTQTLTIFGGGSYQITDIAHANINLNFDVLSRQLITFAPGLIMSSILFVFSLLLGLLWLTARGRTEPLWLGLLVALRSHFDWQNVHFLRHDAGPFSFNLLSRLGEVALLELCFVSMGLNIRWFRPIFWAIGCGTLFLGFAEARPTQRALNAAAVLVLLFGWWRNGGLRQPWIRHLTAGTLALLAIARLNSGGGGFFPVFLPMLGYMWSVQSMTTALFAAILTVLIIVSLGTDRREKQRLAGELEAARVVQQYLLPQSDAATAAFHSEAVYEPAQVVGGDFYWTRLDKDGALLVALGDVSGKGLKAAMLVSVAVGILRNEKSTSPVAILAALNEGLTGHTGGGFVTCCCARFDVDGTVTIANAGHPSPYCDGREVEVEAGLPLGIMADVAYDELVVRGRRFTFVSDGVVEAENAQRELFGFERTREVSMQSAQEIADAAKAWGQTDDITVVTVRRNA